MDRFLPLTVLNNVDLEVDDVTQRRSDVIVPTDHPTSGLNFTLKKGWPFVPIRAVHNQ
jgi:hypothetical protein